MKESEIRELLEKHGYIFDKIVRFKTRDRIRWHSEDLKISLNLGKKIEDITEETLSQFVLSKSEITRLKAKHHEILDKV